MTAPETPLQTKLELLSELFASATHDASAAMCRWTDGLIRLTLDEVCELPLADACGELALGDELLTMVVLDLVGELGGAMILTFDETNGRQLAAALLRRPIETTEPWSDLEKSALAETGNILGCAYMNALTRLVDRDLTPSPPYFLQDYGASVLEQALLTQAVECDTVLVCRTTFQRRGENLSWRVIFIPSRELRCALEGALR